MADIPAYVTDPELRVRVEALPHIERAVLLRGNPLRGYTDIVLYMERRESLPHKLGDRVESKPEYFRRMTGWVADIFYDQREVMVSPDSGTGFESWGYDELENYG